MDNVTHTLVGVALARAGFKRVTPHATLLLVIAANLPDIDVLSLGGGQLADLEVHRGYTHTFIALPIVALIAVALTAVIGTEKLSFLKAWAVALVGASSHLLLDWTNSFGIRPLLPFSSRWFYLDLNGLYDGVILVALSIALLWPWFVGLVAGEIGRSGKRSGQGSALAGLLFLVLFEGGRWSLHERALTQLNSRLYDGAVPLNVAALPEPNNPFKWTGVVETQDAYRIVETGALDLSNASDSRVFFKPAQGVAYKAAVRNEAFRYFLYFSRFPVWGIEPVQLNSGVGKHLDLSDLRFGVPGEGSFHAIALVDAAGQLLESGFRFDSDEAGGRH